MKKELVEQIREAAKEVYLHLLSLAKGNHQEKFRIRELIVDALEKKNKQQALKRMGFEESIYQLIVENTDTEEKSNVFKAFLFIDWTGHFTYDEINLYSLQRFFEERPALSLSAISTQAGLSDKYIRLILAEERNLTEAVKAKLKPVLMLYGWGDRPTKQN